MRVKGTPQPTCHKMSLLKAFRAIPLFRAASFACKETITCTRCVHLTYQTQNDESNKDTQFFIDEETMNIISPKQSNTDPRDIPMLNQEQHTEITHTKPAPAIRDEGDSLPVVRMRIKDQWYQKLPIIHVKATYNNTIFSITDHNGRVLSWTSAGSVGFKNARRGTTFAAQSAAMTAAQKARELGFQKVQVKIKGPGPGRQSSIKGLEGGGLQVVSIQDVTPVPHNGCRPRKARRL